MTWTAGQQQELTRQWGAGVRVAAIAEKLGVTRNAVIGKARSLKLGRHPNAYDPVKAEKNKKHPKSKKVPPRQVVFDGSPPATTAPEAPLTSPASGAFSGINLLDVGYGQCRYMETKGWCCGKPVERGGMYCAEHHGVVYVPCKKVKQTAIAGAAL
jgi:GcrA cell cycle regulator